MLLTAQRVYSPATKKQGVNVYQYLHGSFVWEIVPEDFLPHRNVGELVSNWIALPHGGNRILSYLDVVVPDDMSAERLAALLSTVREMRAAGNPTAHHVQDAWVRFFCWPRIPWSTELHALIGHLELCLQGRPVAQNF